MSNPKQVTRAELEAIIAERCPTMSPATRAAVLQGAVLELADGSIFQAPVVGSDKPTHTARYRVKKIGDKWINN